MTRRLALAMIVGGAVVAAYGYRGARADEPTRPHAMVFCPAGSSCFDLGEWPSRTDCAIEARAIRVARKGRLSCELRPRQLQAAR